MGGHLPYAPCSYTDLLISPFSSQSNGKVSEIKPVAPIYTYMAVSLSNVIATTCQYEALKYVSFPVQTLVSAESGIWHLTQKATAICPPIMLHVFNVNRI